jgi:hypothetical protein
MDLTYTPGGDLPTGGGDQGPIYDGANPPHGADESTPRGEDGPDFDPGPALMVAGSDAYNAVIEGGGSHMDGMQAMGGAIMEAGAEMGIPAADMTEGMSSFTEGYNTAQTEGGDAGTCINAGFDAADSGSEIGDMHPPADYPIVEPPEFPSPGEGLIGEAGAVDLPAEMTHDYAEGPMADDHPANEYEAGGTYGPGSEGCAHVDEEGNPMPDPAAGGAEGGGDDMFGAPLTAATAEAGNEGGNDEPNMTGEPAYEGGPPTVAPPEGADVLDTAMDSNAIDNAGGGEPLVLGDEGFVEAEAVPTPPGPDSEDGMG